MIGRFLKNGLVPIAVLVAAALPLDVAAKSLVHPNIVLVFIDDLGWADLSCFGNNAVETTNIDRLAAGGIRFEQFYVNSPICSPSRTAISTGQYPQRWRITSFLAERGMNEKRGMAQWLDPRAPMLARMLREAGYTTGHFGKWHMGGQRDVGEAPLITEYGFDESLTNFEGLGPRVLPLLDAFDGKPPRKYALGSDKLDRGTITWERRDKVTATYVNAAIDFIEKAKSANRPFYVNVWPDDVHTPLFPPEGMRGNDRKRALYRGVLENMDQQLGVLFDRIRQDPSLRDNTLILVCSDNGPEGGAGLARPLRGTKGMLYDGGIRSPLVVWGPGFVGQEHRGATNAKSIFAAIDLVPTLLALAQVDKRTDVVFDGEAMPDVLIGRSDASRTASLFFRRPPDRPQQGAEGDLPDLAVRDGRWKLLCEYDGTQPQLYDLESDRRERNNVAAIHPDIVQSLTEAALKWHDSMPPDRGPSFDD